MISDSTGEQTGPGQQLNMSGGSEDPVKDYLRQIGKIPLLTKTEETDLAVRIEAGLHAGHKLSQSGGRDGQRERDLHWICNDGAKAKDHLVEANLRLVVSLASATPVEACHCWI